MNHSTQPQGQDPGTTSSQLLAEQPTDLEAQRRVIVLMGVESDWLIAEGSGLTHATVSSPSLSLPCTFSSEIVTS